MITVYMEYDADNFRFILPWFAKWELTKDVEVFV